MTDIKRFTITTTPTHHERLAALANSYQLSQGEVLEVLMDNMGASETDLVAAFFKRREDKVNSRTSIHAITQRLRKERKAGK